MWFYLSSFYFSFLPEDIRVKQTLKLFLSSETCTSLCPLRFIISNGPWKLNQSCCYYCCHILPLWLRKKSSYKESAKRWQSSHTICCKQTHMKTWMFNDIGLIPAAATSEIQFATALPFKWWNGEWSTSFTASVVNPLQEEVPCRETNPWKSLLSLWVTSRVVCRSLWAWGPPEAVSWLRSLFLLLPPSSSAPDFSQTLVFRLMSYSAPFSHFSSTSPGSPRSPPLFKARQVRPSRQKTNP